MPAFYPKQKKLNSPLYDVNYNSYFKTLPTSIFIGDF